MADAEATRQRIELLLREQGAYVEPGTASSLGALCRAMSDELDLVGAAVTLMPGVGAHPVTAASSPAARDAEESQFDLGEGPTRDAFTLRRPVLIADLGDVGALRWAGWAPTALGAGIGAVYALPMHLGATIFGVLTAYRSGAGLTDAELPTALVFAEVATEILLDGSLPGEVPGLDLGLDAALDTHAHVYQAQGMVMVELGVTLPEALARMRAHAWATGQDLTTLAGEILARRVVLPGDER